MRNLLHNIWHLPRNLIVVGLRVYQLTFSPDYGPLRHLYTYGYCRHSPSCSMYAIDMVKRRGALIGGLLAAKRVLTCHPWAKLSDAKMQELAAKR